MGEDTKVHGLSGSLEHEQNTRSVFPAENLFFHQSAEALAIRTERACKEHHGCSDTSALPDIAHFRVFTPLCRPVRFLRLE